MSRIDSAVRIIEAAPGTIYFALTDPDAMEVCSFEGITREAIDFTATAGGSLARRCAMTIQISAAIWATAAMSLKAASETGAG